MLSIGVLRQPMNVSIIFFTVACFLLFFAFNSTQEGSLECPPSQPPPLTPLHDPSNGKTDDLADRLRHSDLLWSNSLKGRKHMVTSYEKSTVEDRVFPKDYLRPYNLYEFIYPSFNCPHDVERIGRVGDGGKWVCGMTKYEANTERPCIVYSFGVNDDSGFENSILTRTNCEIWGYDYTVDAWGKQLNQEHAGRAHFLKAGITNVTDETRSPAFYSVQDLMKKNGHDYIDIMKMDIEGSEFDALGSFLGEYSDPNQQLPIGQLLLETHMRATKEDDPFSLPLNLEEWLAFWESLEAKGLRVSSLEPNMLGNFNHGAPLFAETTLINVEDDKSLLVH